MSWQTLQTLTHINKLFHLLIRLVNFLQLRVHRKRPVQRDIQLRRNHLGDPVYKSIRKIHHAPHIPDHTTGRQSTESDDLHYSIGAVFSCNVIDDFLPPLETKIHVNIRHRYSLRIQEPLKKQVVTDRINIRDSQAVCHNTARRGSTPRPHHNLVVSGVFDKIPYNQEVVHIPHGADCLQLITKSVYELLRTSWIPFL